MKVFAFFAVLIMSYEAKMFSLLKMFEWWSGVKTKLSGIALKPFLVYCYFAQGGILFKG